MRGSRCSSASSFFLLFFLSSFLPSFFVSSPFAFSSGRDGARKRYSCEDCRERGMSLCDRGGLPAASPPFPVVCAARERGACGVGGAFVECCALCPPSSSPPLGSSVLCVCACVCFFFLGPRGVREGGMEKRGDRRECMGRSEWVREASRKRRLSCESASEDTPIQTHTTRPNF